ncbi:MAG: sugar ABC transporter ATP-binding protein [Clostridiales Family XIII bacterium]|jgi:ABC-type sugar transport system ATPase subunit|nr:sugar ABC transporter ATP-binding protein [Clostridiales Family XIII bacterium]
MKQELLRLEDITVSYSGVQVLNRVSLSIMRGETVVLMGENGAGKSTLIKLLCGMTKMDGGRVWLDEDPVEIHSPSEAMNLGIHCILQEPSVAGNLTVAQNIFLYSSYQPTTKIYSGKTVQRYAKDLLDRIGIRLDPDAYARDLSVSQRFLLFVAMAMCIESKLLVMDETTASMDPQDSETIERIIRGYKEKGNAVLFITQDVEEAMRIADRIVILRDGRNAGSLRRKNFYLPNIVRMMTGRPEGREAAPARADGGREVFRIENATIPGELRDVTLSVNEGEIVGVIGLLGSGKSSVARASFGITRLSGGDIYVRGKRQRSWSAYKAMKQKVVYLPEDRLSAGIFANFNAEENIVAGIAKRVSRGGFIRRRISRYVTNEYIKRLNISLLHPGQNAKTLSGGTQQKLILSRSMAAAPILLIADEPTNGLDIATRGELRALFRDLAAAGIGILYISSNTQEILQICHRVVVLSRGRVKKVLSRGEALFDERLADELY